MLAGWLAGWLVGAEKGSADCFLQTVVCLCVSYMADGSSSALQLARGEGWGWGRAHLRQPRQPSQYYSLPQPVYMHCTLHVLGSYMYILTKLHHYTVLTEELLAGS